MQYHSSHSLFSISVWKRLDSYGIKRDFCIHDSLHYLDHHAQLFPIDAIQQGQHRGGSWWHYILLYLFALLFHGSLGIKDYTFHKNRICKYRFFFKVMHLFYFRRLSEDVITPKHNIFQTNIATKGRIVLLASSIRLI